MTLPQIAIRRAATPDTAAIAELEELTLTDPWTAEMVRGSLADAATIAFLGENDSVAVGYAIFQRAADELELLRLGVDPAWRRAGIGGELVARGLAYGLDERLAACFLEVRADNEPARRLYERLGFALAGVRRRYYPDGTDAGIYRRAFRAAPG